MSRREAGRGYGSEYDLVAVLRIAAVGATSNEYEICRTTALELVDNDINAAELLLNGLVTINKTFRNLKTSEEHIVWICENVESGAEK